MFYTVQLIQPSQTLHFCFDLFELMINIDESLILYNKVNTFINTPLNSKHVQCVQKSVYKKTHTHSQFTAHTHSQNIFCEL